MDEFWRIELLGGLRAIRADQVVTRFRTRKTAALLAYLAFYPQHPHPREALIELLWPECDPTLGRRSLRTALSSLRQQLEPPGMPPSSVICADRRSVWLNPQGCATDVAEFEAALRAEPRGTRTEPFQRLVEGIESYRGELLPGYFDDWILPERVRLAELFQQALYQVTALAEASGDLGAAIRWARRAVVSEPLREEGYHRLIRLLAADGQPDAALRLYRDLERRMAQNLGGSPDPELAAFVEALSRGSKPTRLPVRQEPDVPEASVLETDAGAGQAAILTSPNGPREIEAPLGPLAPVGSHHSSARSVHLPRQFTRFFGREREVEQLLGLLTQPESSLVTLIGPGGVGKTRLALRVAQDPWLGFTGGIWFVPLLDVADPWLMMGKVVQQLRLPSAPHQDPVDQLAATLSSGRCLLVLDNFEHLGEAGAEQLQRLRERVDDLFLLVTSRQCLGLPGERVVTVEPLPVPGVPAVTGAVEPAPPTQRISAERLTALAACPSVDLFLDRARAVRPVFPLTVTNAATIAALCSELEGLPLALELAAARAGVLTPRQMLDHLRGQRDLLVSRQRTADPRHRSLRICLDWSYQQLPPDLQRLFARLAVFRGGWTLEAMEAVCCEDEAPVFTGGSALSQVEALCERSLAIPEPVGEVMRYRLLEVVRQYASDHLRSAGEEARLRDRHLEFFTQVAEQADNEIAGENSRTWLDCCETEHDNLRAALDWAAEPGRVPMGLQLGAALYRFWRVRGYWTEGRERLRRLLALPEAAGGTALRARALVRAGKLSFFRGDPEIAWALADESLANSRELGDSRSIAAALGFLGYVAHMRDDFTTAQPLMEESLAIRRQLNDPHEIAQMLNELGGLSYRQGQFEAAARCYEEALAIWRESGRRVDTQSPLYNRGLVALHQDDSEMARRCFSEALAIARELGDLEEVAGLLNFLGSLAYGDSNIEAARACFEESLAIHRQRERRKGVAGMLNWLGLLAYVQGDFAGAAALCEESLSLARDGGGDRFIAEILSRLGDIACSRDQPTAAAGLFREALVRFRNAPDPPGLQKLGPRNSIARCLEGLAAVARAHSDPERAARLLGAADGLRQSIGSSRPLPERPISEHRITAVRGAMSAEGFAVGWVDGQAMSLERAVGYALGEVEAPTELGG